MAKAINSLAGAMFTVYGPSDVNDRLKEFLAVSCIPVTWRHGQHPPLHACLPVLSWRRPVCYDWARSEVRTKKVVKPSRIVSQSTFCWTRYVCELTNMNCCLFTSIATYISCLDCARISFPNHGSSGVVLPVRSAAYKLPSSVQTCGRTGDETLKTASHQFRLLRACACATNCLLLPVPTCTTLCLDRPQNINPKNCKNLPQKISRLFFCQCKVLSLLYLKRVLVTDRLYLVWPCKY